MSKSENSSIARGTSQSMLGVSDHGHFVADNCNIRLMPFPSQDSFRKWKMHMRRCVINVSSNPKKASAWLAKVDSTKEVEDLKLFKTKAITVFAVVQFAMAAIVFAMKFMG